MIQLSFLRDHKCVLHCKAKPQLACQAPSGDGFPLDAVGTPLKCCSGTRDAGALWEECFAKILTDLGFTRGTACPTCFWHAERGISIALHGDDFVAL